jgi:hypothetical protein
VLDGVVDEDVAFAEVYVPLPYLYDGRADGLGDLVCGPDDPPISEHSNDPSSPEIDTDHPSSDNANDHPSSIVISPLHEPPLRYPEPEPEPEPLEPIRPFPESPVPAAADPEDATSPPIPPEPVPVNSTTPPGSIPATLSSVADAKTVLVTVLRTH